MKSEDIIDLWTDDCKVDDVDLDVESLKIPTLHGKYLRIYSKERKILRALEIKRKQLKQTLYDYFKGDLNDPSTLEELKRQPFDRIVLKNEIPDMIDADNAMMQLNIRMAVQRESVEVCEEIMKSINTRGFAIKNAIEWRRLTNFGT